MNLEVAVLDENFQIIGQIDEYESLIWTDRYYDVGDFEIYARASTELLSLIQNGRYAQIKDSNKVMFIEDVSIESEIDRGDYITVTGRSLESMLSRAIVLKKITVENGSVQDLIKRVMNENMIEPTDPNRDFTSLSFQDSSDPKVLEATVSVQVFSEEVLDVVKTLCLVPQLGFEIVLASGFTFIFDLYAGADRSRNQTENPYIVFAPQNENISSSRYFESSKDLKHVAYVFAEYSREVETTETDPETGEETTTTETVTTEEMVVVGEGVDLNRRELYVDARDLSSTTESGSQISRNNFLEMMRVRGVEALKEYETVKTFDGEVDASKEPRYGVDFFMGDIVEVANAYGMSSTARVIELVRTIDASGYKEVPAFIML